MRRPGCYAGPVLEDLGDADLRAVLDMPGVQQRVPLVLFGHMHHTLNWRTRSMGNGRGMRNMAHIDPSGAACSLEGLVMQGPGRLISDMH